MKNSSANCKCLGAWCVMAEKGCGEMRPQISRWLREDGFARRHAHAGGAARHSSAGVVRGAARPLSAPSSPRAAAPLRAGGAPSGGGAARAAEARIRIPEPERSGAGAERAERAEPAAELGARAGGMYRARAARAGPEPGSPGRFGILSTGQLRDLLQDEPKLDRIVRLSRKVARGARAGGSGVGPRPAGPAGPAGPAERPKGRAGRAAGPPVGAGAWHVRVGPAEPPPREGAPGAGLGRVGRGKPRESPVHPRDGREACPIADAPGRCVPGGRGGCVVGGPGSHTHVL